jgi:hypothetical protein
MNVTRFLGRLKTSHAREELAKIAGGAAGGQLAVVACGWAACGVGAALVGLALLDVVVLAMTFWA